MDLRGSGSRMSDPLWRPVAPCGGLCRQIRSPYILRSQILEAWVWRPGAWMSGCWKDWNGLGEVTEVTAFWGEGIGRNSHTLKLQELGGFTVYAPNHVPHLVYDWQQDLQCCSRCAAHVQASLTGTKYQMGKATYYKGMEYC